MKRREFITLLGSMAVAWPFAALAQRKSNSYRIGYLALLTGERTTLAKVFLQRLHELGYSEDKNMVFEYRSAEGQADRVPALAAELVRADPDVLVAGFGTVAAKAADARARCTVGPVITAAAPKRASALSAGRRRWRAETQARITRAASGDCGSSRAVRTK